MPLWHQKWSGFAGSQSREKLGKSKPTADSPLGSRQTLTALCPLLNSSPALQVCGAEDSGHQGELEDDLVLEEEAKILTVGGGGWGGRAGAIKSPALGWSQSGGGVHRRAEETRHHLLRKGLVQSCLSWSLSA